MKDWVIKGYACKLTSSLSHVLYGFRHGARAIAVFCDIKEMVHQVKIRAEDKMSLSIVVQERQFDETV